jgi:uncharacterized protein (TIRG00374 family)
VFDGLDAGFVFFASRPWPCITLSTVPPSSPVSSFRCCSSFWITFDQARANRIYRLFSGHLLPVRFRSAADNFFERFMSGLYFLRRGRDVLMVFVTSIVIWLLETVKYWFVMHAFAFSVSFVGLMLMNGVVNLTTTLPSAPGYIGTFEVGARVLEALGVNYDLAFGYTIVLHAALWFPITMLGGYYMWRQGVKWRDFERRSLEQ